MDFAKTYRIFVPHSPQHNSIMGIIKRVIVPIIAIAAIPLLIVSINRKPSMDFPTGVQEAAQPYNRLMIKKKADSVDAKVAFRSSMGNSPVVKIYRYTATAPAPPPARQVRLTWVSTLKANGEYFVLQPNEQYMVIGYYDQFDPFWPWEAAYEFEDVVVNNDNYQATFSTDSRPGDNIIIVLDGTAGAKQ